MKRIGIKSGKKKHFWAKFPKLYRYRNKAVPVHPNRSQPVLIQVQAVPVHPNRIQLVPVQVKGVPVQVCPKYPDCVVFAYLSLNSYTVSMGTLLND